MKTIFKIWFAFALFAYTLAFVVYVFINDSVDAVEELTFSDVAVMFLPIRSDPEPLLRRASFSGIDIDVYLEDALDDHDEIDDYDIDIAENLPASIASTVTGVDLVSALFTTEDNTVVELLFAAQDKEFLGELAKVHTLVKATINKDGREFEIKKSASQTDILAALFDTDQGRLPKVLAKINEDFENLYIPGRFDK